TDAEDLLRARVVGDSQSRLLLDHWLLRLLQNLHDAPALGRGQRTGLHQKNAVTDASGVLLVVRLELAGAADDLAVQRVLDPVLDGDDDGLVHLVADHEALAGLAPA